MAGSRKVSKDQTAAESTGIYRITADNSRMRPTAIICRPGQFRDRPRKPSPRRRGSYLALRDLAGDLVAREQVPGR